jgi:hypothetical protein
MAVIKSAGLLDVADLLHPASNLDRGREYSLSAQFLEGNLRDFYVSIDAVEQRPADFVPILLDLSERAATLARGVAPKTTLACVHLTNLVSVKPECRLMAGAVQVR